MKASMRGRFNQACRQSGTVLLTVMLMVAVAAFIATEIAYRQKMDVLRTEAFMARDSAFQYLVAAENLGIYALKTDLSDDEKKSQGSPPREIRDDLSEVWNKRVLFPIPGVGMIEGHLEDLSGRFNINSLVVTDSKKAKAYQAAFKSLLDQVQMAHPEAFPQGVTTDMLVERVIDWLDSDSVPTGFAGEEDPDYERKERPYHTANHVITDISELLLIDGFTPALLDVLQDDLACLPPDTPLNLFTANQDVLKAFGFDGTAVAKFVTLERPQAYNTMGSVDYETMQGVKQNIFSELTNANPQGGNNTGNTNGITPVTTTTTGTTTGSTSANINPDLFDIKSDYYLLKGKAIVNDRPVQIESVIWRPRTPAGSGAGNNAINAAQTGSNPPEPPKVIIRKFVDPLKQV